MVLSVDRDNSGRIGFLGRRVGRRVSVFKSGPSRRDRDGWQVCTLARGLYIPIITCWEVFKPFKNLLGGFYRLHWLVCAEAILPYMWKTLKFFAVLTLRKKKWHRNKELTTVEFEPGTAGSEIRELPTNSRGSLDEFSWLKRRFMFGFFVLWWIWVSAGVFRCQHVELHLWVVSVACLFFCRPEMEAGIEHFFRTTGVNSWTLFPSSSSPKIIVSPE